MINEPNTEEPLTIFGETLDFWELILYVIIGGFSYQYASFRRRDQYADAAWFVLNEEIERKFKLLAEVSYPDK